MADYEFYDEDLPHRRALNLLPPERVAWIVAALFRTDTYEQRGKDIIVAAMERASFEEADG